MGFRVKFDYFDKNGVRCLFDYWFESYSCSEDRELEEYFTNFCKEIGAENLFFQSR